VSKMVDFEELLSKTQEVEKKKIDEELKKAFTEANLIVDEAYNEILSEYSKRIQEIISKNIEALRGEEAKLEVETKRAVNKEKDYWVQQVFQKTLDELEKIANTKDYKNRIESILSRELTEGAIVYCSNNDKKFIEGILTTKRINNVSVEVDNSIKGGVKIYYPDKKLTRDFTLKTILNQIFEDLRDDVARILFGE